MLTHYDNPVAFHCIKTRLALVEKGVEFKTYNIDILNGQSLEPWFLKINPNATVPVLTDSDNGKVINESQEILEYVDSLGDGPLGGPNTDRALVSEWVGRLCSWDGNLYGLGTSTGGSIKKFFLKDFNDFKIKFSEARMAENPDLVDAYRRKIESLSVLLDDSEDPAKVEANNKELMELFDDAETQLRKTKWLAGDEYTMADVVMTCILWKSLNGGTSSEYLKPRQRLREYFEAVQKRPSWKVAVEISGRATNFIAWSLPGLAKAQRAKFGCRV
ncbi:Ganglioside induced differentiation associated protein [Quaeritorhiza haematococci]|nr:Ganglioside induced differentiation associated protein [Quaeritorhiza haematococci]